MKHIHFIGIGGISMSSLACILKSRGYQVTGSDLKATAVTRSLEEQGNHGCHRTTGGKHYAGNRCRRIYRGGS